MLEMRSPLDGFASPFGAARGASGVTFTDVLTDGGGTPVVISTSIATRQAYQRGRSNIVLSGTYSVTGGTPSGMAWRVGSGAWVQFATETIGAGNWQGTLAIPASYTAQGTLEVKPVNGLNVTPAQVSNITVGDVIGFGGQSNINQATNLQTYTGSNYTWTNKDAAGAWSAQTGDWNGGAAGSFGPAFADAVDAADLPPITHVIAQADGTGYSSGDWNPGNLIYEQFKTRLSAEIAKTGGYHRIVFVFAENDSTAGQTKAGWKTASDAMLDDLIAAIPDLASTKFQWVVLGEHSGSGLDAVRQGIIEFADEDSRVEPGPSLMGFDFGDGVHYGTVGGAIDSAEADAQLVDIGAIYYRAVFGVTASGPSIASGSVGSGADAAKVTLTFDRALENHSDVTGWTVTDTVGSLTVSSAAQGASAAQVVLTCSRALYGETLVSFGLGNASVGATLREATAVAGVKMAPAYRVSLDAGDGVGAAPVNTVAPSLGGSTNVGGTASATNGTYSGVPTPSVGSFQWQRSDDGLTGWADLSGATSATYVIQAGDVAKYIRRGEVASNAVGSAARAYTAASIAITAENPIAAWVVDGELTNLTLGSASTTGVSGTANVADNDGGNDAATITSSTAGTVGASAFNTNQQTFNNGVNHVRFRVKDVGANAPWLRVGFINTTISIASQTWMRPSDGAKGATPGANVTSHTVTSEGNGWYTVDIYVNMAGADCLGNLQINFATSDGGSTINRTGTEAFSLHDLTVGY